MMRAILGNARFYVMTKGGVAAHFLGLFLSGSVRETSEAGRCIVLKKVLS